MNLFERHHLRFYIRRCSPAPVLSPDIAFRLIGAEAFPWDRHPLVLHHAAYRDRFAAGGEALLGYSGEDIAFSAWIERRSLRVDELRWSWRLASRDAAVYDVLTFEAWRGRGIYPLALRSLNGMLFGQDVENLWIYAEKDNSASLRGIEKAEFEYRGSISAVVLAGMAFRSGTVEGVNA